VTDLFADKAQDWDARPVPVQISRGVGEALRREVELRPDMRVLDFGAGTGLVAGQVAPEVASVVALDVSQAMLDQLAAKPELEGKVETRCQDILLVVSAMALHHVEDTGALMRAFYDHLAPGGRIALADLDTEDGSFHPPGTEGVFHAGFDRAELKARMEAAGFEGVRFRTACEVDREARRYPIFLAVAHARPPTR
jgi:cyclopropane fatty-acyl-phospholipid synthase-like methyltransferase